MNVAEKYTHMKLSTGIGDKVLQWDDMDYYMDEGEWKVYCKENGYEDLGDEVRYSLISENTEFGWNHTMAELSHLIQELNPDTYYWLCVTENEGWRHRSGGYKFIEIYSNGSRHRGETINEGQSLMWIMNFNSADNRMEFFKFVAPDGRNGFVIQMSNHDASGQLFYMLPLTEEEWEGEN